MCVSAAQLSHLVINEVDKCLTSFTALCSFVSLLNKTKQKCVDTPTRAVWQAKLTSSCPNCVMLLFVECCELSPSEGRQEEEHRGRRRGRGEENLYKITAFSLAGTSLASPHCGSVAVASSGALYYQISILIYNFRNILEQLSGRQRHTCSTALLPLTRSVGWLGWCQPGWML